MNFNQHANEGIPANSIDDYCVKSNIYVQLLFFCPLNVLFHFSFMTYVLWRRLSHSEGIRRMWHVIITFFCMCVYISYAMHTTLACRNSQVMGLDDLIKKNELGWKFAVRMLVLFSKFLQGTIWIRSFSHVDEKVDNTNGDGGWIVGHDKIQS